MTKATEIRDNVLSDCIIDDNELGQLKQAISEDGGMAMEYASMLFEINNSVTGNPNSKNWDSFFVDSLYNVVVSEFIQDGVISQQGVDFICKNVMEDEEVDEAEKELVLKILEKSTNTNDELRQKLVELINLTE